MTDPARPKGNPGSDAPALAELDLDDDERAHITARGKAGHAVPPPPPPPPVPEPKGPDPVFEIDAPGLGPATASVMLKEAQPAQSSEAGSPAAGAPANRAVGTVVDTGIGTVGGAGFRAGVPRGAASGPHDETDVVDATRLAGFGPAPSGAVGAVAYAIRVWRRKQALGSVLPELRAKAVREQQELVRRLAEAGRGARAQAQVVAAYAPTLARVRQLESIARSSAEAGQAFELALADLGRQAAFDTEHFADGAFADRRVLGVLERSAKDAERSVRLHELALTRYDAATYRRGTMMLVAALALALATIVARPIYFALFPPVTYDPPDIVRPKGR